MVAPTYTLADVRFSYEPDGPTVLGPLSLAIAPGSFVGVLGPNGAGKSTLLRLLAGAARPRAGTVTLDGVDLAARPPAEVARTVAVLPASSAVSFAFAALEVVLMGRAPHQRGLALASARDVALARAAMSRAGVAGLEERTLESLSSGERQRIAIARVLVQEARVLLLDEPTAHLDLAHQSATCALFRAEAAAGATVVAALHDPNVAALFCDRLLLLVGGQLVADGAPGDVLSDAGGAAAPVRRAWGDAVHLARHPVEDVPIVLPGRAPRRV